MSDEWDGEYWIDADGTTTFADDHTDHNMLVIEHLFHLWEEDLGLEPEDEYGEGPDLSDPMGSLGARSGMGEDEMVRVVADQRGHDRAVEEAGILRWSNRAMDPREYAMEHWGWKAYRDGNIESFRLTRVDLDAISRGLWEICSDAGPASTFIISTIRGDRYEVTLADIDSGDLSGRTRADLGGGAAGAAAQVDKMARDDQPDVYKGRLGDSLGPLAARLLG